MKKYDKNRGGIPNTASFLGDVQVKDDLDENEKENFAIMWEILRCSLGDYCGRNTQD